MSKTDGNEINSDSVEELRELLKYAVENHSWSEVEEAMELTNEILGYEIEEDEEDSGGKKRNHLEE